VPSVIDSPIWGITTSVGMGKGLRRGVCSAGSATLRLYGGKPGSGLGIPGFCTQR